MATDTTTQNATRATAATAEVFRADGTKASTIALPEPLFGAVWRPTLVHDVVIAMQGNARQASAHTKDRGEVAGGGKKPWRQKGTGRARHGSNRSPLWRGGGTTFGPRNEKSYVRKLNRKARACALASVLTRKWADSELVCMETPGFTTPRATEARQVLQAITAAAAQPALVKKEKNAVLFVLPARNEAIEKSFRNFGNVTIKQAKDLNPVDILTSKLVVICEPETVFAQLVTRVTN